MLFGTLLLAVFHRIFSIRLQSNFCFILKLYSIIIGLFITISSGSRTSSIYVTSSFIIIRSNVVVY